MTGPSFGTVPRRRAGWRDSPEPASAGCTRPAPSRGQAVATALLLAAALILAFRPLAAAGPDAAAAPDDGAEAGALSVCTAWGTSVLPASAPDARGSLENPGPPSYYAFPLVTTGRLTGTARAGGTGQVVFPGSSPFGVSLAEDGSYRYELLLTTEGLPDAGARRYVAWVTTPSVDRIRRLGAVPAAGRLEGRVDWNKFLVVVTLEPPAAPVTADDGDDGGDGGSAASPTDGWSGPIVLRGMSRSGMMHTMAGHGPFEQENCASYGY